MSHKAYLPFVFGIQYRSWKSSNCDRCEKSRDNNDGEYKCVLENVIDISYYNQLPIYGSTAKKIGYLDESCNVSSKFVWMCKEVEWNKEWRTSVDACSNKACARMES